MAIVQISKIQTRSGNLVDLPQLDNAEFGFASDENRLFIGRTGSTFSSGNIEVLTSYSNISFSQIDGSDYGNFNITTPLNGQILTYVASTKTWENYTGQNSQLNVGKLQLGNVGNIYMGGGAIGYVLETDGLGNLSWTPKGTLYTNIKALSNATPIVMTVPNTTPYINGQEITISGVLGANANSIVNGKSFYIALANDYPTSGNVSLFTDPTANTNPVSGTNLVATPLTGLATAVLTGTTGIGAAAGVQNSVQFNNSGLLAGNAGFAFNPTTTTLTVLGSTGIGNVNTGNVHANVSVTSGVLVSNIATGTAPLTVTSTTQVGNLYVARAGISDTSTTTLQTTGTYYPVFVNATSGNLAQGANANLSFNVATGNLSATLLTGTLTTNNQPNIITVGTLTNLTVTGNTTSGNFIGIFANGTSNVSIPASAGNVSVGVNGTPNVLVVTNTGINVAGTINATGNITGNVFGPLANGNSNVRIATANGNVSISAVGNTTLTITGTGINVAGTLNTGSGNAIVGNLSVGGIVIANSQLQANVANGTSPLVVLSSTQVPNLYASRANVADTSTFTLTNTGIYYLPLISGTANANYPLNSNAVYSANVSNGALFATTFVGNVIGNISGNITVTGSNTDILFNDNGNANATAGFTFNKTSNLVTISGNLISANANLGNSVTANYFIGSGNNLSNIQGANVSGNVGNALNAYAVAGANVTGNVGNALNAYAVAGANVSGAVNYATVANSVAGANVSGFVANATNANSATTAGTVTTNAQPNITSVGTLTSLGVNGTITAVNIIANSGLITGTLSSNANAQPNITSVGTLTSLAVTGNVVPGGVKTDNYYYANGVQISFAGAYSNTNVAAYLPTFTGTVGATAITTGANTTAGTITGNWSLTAGSRLNATYADLAEYYEADAVYEPGTVLEFGGDKEVTVAQDGTNRVAGVVSTDPAYAMNASCPGIAVAIALQGRVPCKVRGVIKKGDMLVSGGNGYARPAFNPSMGTVIGKALENHEGEGVIEVAVGRL